MFTLVKSLSTDSAGEYQARLNHCSLRHGNVWSVGVPLMGGILNLGFVSTREGRRTDFRVIGAAEIHCVDLAQFIQEKDEMLLVCRVFATNLST